MTVFVSYASPDRKVANAIVAGLERRALHCWCAPRDIDPSERYGHAIVEGIEGCAAMVVVLSRRALSSRHVLREVERASHCERPLIPFRIENVRPSRELELFLSLPHWIDAFAPPLGPHIERLADVVHGVLRGRPPGASAASASTAADAPELPPDEWTRRHRGSFGRFLNRLLEDSER